MDSTTSTPLLPGTTCFRCGGKDGAGITIDVSRDPENPEILRGSFRTEAPMTGFPGLTHGGFIYGVLDCMASWAPTAFRPERALWILRSATMKYHRPTRPGITVRLLSRIEEQGKEWDAAIVAGEARDEEGRLLAEGRFKMIPVSPERFAEITGVDELSPHWRAFLDAKPLKDPSESR